MLLEHREVDVVAARMRLLATITGVPICFLRLRSRDASPPETQEKKKC
jgi:hypothetical protein